MQGGFSMPLLEILAIIAIYVIVSIVKELGSAGHKSTLLRPGNLEKCSKEMIGKSQKECRKILNKYRD